MDEINNLFGAEMINHWISQLMAMGLTIFLIPRLYVTSLFGTIFILFSISLLNAFVWDAALFFSIPTSLTSSAITLFFVNGLLFWVLVKILPGIEVDGVFPALLAPIVFTIVSVLLNSYGKSIDWISIGAMIFDFLFELKKSFQQE